MSKTFTCFRCGEMTGIVYYYDHPNRAEKKKRVMYCERCHNKREHEDKVQARFSRSELPK